MKIRDRVTRGVGAPAPFGERKSPATAESEPGTERSDRVHISDRGVEIRRARSLALAAPEIREELVDAILGQIRRGDYRVRGDQVVPKMIREHAMLAGR